MKTGLRVFAPVILLVGLLIFLELALRFFNYGYSTSYIVQRTTPTGPRALLNPGALLSYLSLGSANGSNEAFLNVPVDKPDNNIRVVVLGGSAVHGSYHSIGLNFPRYLEAMMKIRFPGHTVNVVNLAFPGLNSSAMVRLVREALSLKPDFVVFYQAGNDVGWLQPLQEGPLPSKAVFLAGETAYTLKRLKLYQLVVNCAGRYTRKIPAFLLKGKFIDARSFQGVSPALSDSLAAAYRHNVRKITAVCKQNGIPVFLCTYAHNMKNLCSAAPLADGGTGLEEIEAGLPLLRQAYAYESAGDYWTAIFYYEIFQDRFPRFAGPLCHMAFCYHALGQSEKAAQLYDSARRLSTGFSEVVETLNRVLKDIAAASSEDNVFLVDIVEALKAASPLGFMPDEAYFTDLVHFTSAGSYATAAEIFQSLATRLDENTAARPPSIAECDRLMGVTPLQHEAVMAAKCKVTFAGLTSLLGGPPKSYALMHDVTKEHALKLFADKLSSSGQALDPEILKTHPLSDDPDYYFYKNQVAELSAAGKQEAALAVARQLAEATDRHPLALILYGQTLFRNNRPETALNIFQEVLGQPDRAFDLELRLAGARALLQLDRPTQALDMLAEGWRIIENREPVIYFEKRSFEGFRQRYLSTMKGVQHILSAREKE